MALVTVLVMLMLSLVLILGASRVTFLNEHLAGNSTDYQRAYEAAEALLGDARLDVACQWNGSCGTRVTALSLNCSTSDVLDLEASLGGLTPKCRDGICLDLGAATSGDPATSFWNDPTQWALYTGNNRGARYGQYTNTGAATNTAINPLLVDHGWYWIEILRYGASVGGGRSVDSEQVFLNGRQVKPHKDCQFVFRITAVVQGRRAGTTAVLQTHAFFRPIS